MRPDLRRQVRSAEPEQEANRADTGGEGAARDPSLAAETLSGGTAGVSPAAAAAEEGRRGHTAVPAATRTGTASGSGAE